jgi:hypothetical protein
MVDVSDTTGAICKKYVRKAALLLKMTYVMGFTALLALVTM